MRLRLVLALALTLLALALLGGAAGAAAPASTFLKPNWLPADKQGFGTSRTPASKVWFTLAGGELSEVYYPGSTPAPAALCTSCSSVVACRYVRTCVP